MTTTKRVSKYTSTTGRAAGSQTSTAKAEAARRNGARGGRPKKPNGETAHVQPSPKKPNEGMTVKQAATLMQVSERSVYYVREIQRYAPDLCPAIEAGKMKIKAAMQILQKRRDKLAMEIARS